MAEDKIDHEQLEEDDRTDPTSSEMRIERKSKFLDTFPVDRLLKLADEMIARNERIEIDHDHFGLKVKGIIEN